MNRSDDLVSQAATRISRRAVVGTGAKLAYGVPLIAASFKITARGAGAGNHGHDGDVCDCVDKSRSPKPGKLVNGDRSLCYVCKGPTSGTTVCGDKVQQGSIQATWGKHGPVCACESSKCKVNGKWVDRGGVITCKPKPVDCGGGTVS